MELIQRMMALTGAAGVSGEENQAGALLAGWCREMKLGEVTTDPFHNVFCTVRPSAPGEPHLLL